VIADEGQQQQQDGDMDMSLSHEAGRMLKNP
jgi:hypothetical protein